MKRSITKNKFKFILLGIMTICILSSFIYAYSSLTNYKPKYGKLTANVNFRNTASTSTGKIRTLTKGTTVKMVGNIDSFYIVQLGSNEVGLVSKSYVTSSSTAPKGALTYTTINLSNATITTDNVTLRQGPGTNFAKITSLKKSTTVKTIGYINNWYIVITSNNKVGCIRNDLIKIGSTTTKPPVNSGFEMTANEKIIFDLINKARTNNGLPKLKADANLFKISRLKAKDMVKNSYFSHSSPTYGSPFKMMNTYGISYKTAGENIAGNPNLQSAVTAWLNSETHRKNILSSSYNYIGIGIEPSEIYGYIISTMFVGR